MARILSTTYDDSAWRFTRQRRVQAATLELPGAERLIEMRQTPASAPRDPHERLFAAIRRDRPELAEMLGL